MVYVGGRVRPSADRALTATLFQHAFVLPRGDSIEILATPPFAVFRIDHGLPFFAENCACSTLTENFSGQNGSKKLK